MMTKLFKILNVVIITMFLNIFVVRADGCSNVRIVTDGVGSPTSFSYGYQSGSVRYKIYDYRVRVNGGASISAYCHNPGIHAWEKTNEVLNCERELFDPTNNSVKQNIYDSGIIYLLKSAPNKWLAINLYQLLFSDRVDVRYAETDMYSSQLYYLENQINKYLDEKNENNKAKRLREKVSALKKTYGSSIGKKYSGVSRYNDSNGVDSAMDYVLNALDVAIDYANNGGPTVKIGNPTRKKANTETELRSTFTYKIDIKEFAENSEIYLSYNCTRGCNIADVKFYLNNEVKSASELSNTNLVKLVQNNSSSKKYSGTVEFVIEYSGPVREDCDETRYKISLKYRDEALAAEAYEVDECSNVEKCQRLYVLAGNNTQNYRTTDIENQFQLCSTSKEVGECKTYVGDASCVPCEENDNKVEIKEGYDTEDVCTEPTEDDLNIKKCVASNSARDTSGNTHKSNDYTSEAGSGNFAGTDGGNGIYCKEDYTLTLPGSRKVDAGRYFVLRSQIEGTKSCYSTRIKDNTATNSSVKAAAQSTVNVYKNYAKAKALLECLNGGGSGRCHVSSFYTSGGVCRTRPVTRKRYAQKEEDEPCPEGYTETTFAGKPTCEQEYTDIDRIYYLVPGIDVYWDYTYYNGNSCTPVTENAFKTWTTSNRGRWLCLNDDELADSKFMEELYNSVDELTPSLERELGEEANFTCNCTGDPSKGPVDCPCSGRGATGFTAGLGTGGMWSILKNYNKVIGFYTGGSDIGGGTVTEGGGGYSGTGEGSYGVTLNPNPFGGWQVGYNFNPEMHFWYQERYMKNVLTDTLDRYDESIERLAPLYCTGDVSDDYEECSGLGGWKKSLSLGAIGDTSADIYQDRACACTTEGCKWYTYAIANVKYIKQTAKAEAKFVTPTQFYNIYPTGAVPVGLPGLEIDNATVMENGLPVELGSESGGKVYLLWYENLGEYYNGDTLGRIWGNYNSVVATTLQASEACRTERSSIIFEDETNDVYHDEGLYKCRYDVNECSQCKEEVDNYCDPACPNDPDCPSSGSCSSVSDGMCKAGCPADPDCYCASCPPDIKNRCAVLKDENGGSHYYDRTGKETSMGTYYSQCCPNGRCQVNCKSCLFDGTDLKASYRQITNEDLNPNDRSLGTNWAWDNNINTAIELKAYVTTKEIEENSNSIYEVDFENTSDEQDFAMQVTMDPKAVNWIRDYNQTASGGYLNNTLECYDLEVGENIYDNVYCYSTFIDEMINDNVGNIKIAGAERPMDENGRKAYSNGYFISWQTDNINTQEWEVRTERGIEYYTSNFGMVYDKTANKDVDYRVGPSWK